MYVCIFWFKGASTPKVIGAHNEMMKDDYDDQMIFGDLVGLKLPDIRLTGEEKPRKNLTQETCPDLGSNPGLLRDKRACCHLCHSGGHQNLFYIIFADNIWEQKYPRCAHIKNYDAVLHNVQKLNCQYKF